MAKKAIVIQDILDLLADGKNRKEINELYGFNPAEAKFVWDNEKLKGVKKAKYSIGIELVDDLPTAPTTIPFPSGTTL